MGKTGTTALQRIVFPRLARALDVPYLEDSHPVVRLHLARLRLRMEPLPLQLPDSYLVSCEGLCGWDPYEWEHHAACNVAAFGPAAHVLITVREPATLLTSMYLQRCLHEGDVQRPEHFFLPDDLYSPHLPIAKCAIDRFSYTRLVRIYAQRFATVSVVKYENLRDLRFLRPFWDAEPRALEEMRAALQSVSSNRSYSRRSVRYTRLVAGTLERLGYQLASGERRRALAALDEARRFAVHAEPPPAAEAQKSPRPWAATVRKLLELLARELKWRHFLQHRLDRVLPYERFRLDFDALKQIDLARLARDYEALPEGIVRNATTAHAPERPQAASRQKGHY